MKTKTRKSQRAYGRIGDVISHLEKNVTRPVRGLDDYDVKIKTHKLTDDKKGVEYDRLLALSSSFLHPDARSC